MTTARPPFRRSEGCSLRPLGRGCLVALCLVAPFLFLAAASAAHSQENTPGNSQESSQEASDKNSQEDSAKSKDSTEASPKADPLTGDQQARDQQATEGSADEIASRVESAFQASIDLIKPHDELIIQAFKDSSEGWSSDEVILQDRLNKQFLASAKEKLAKAGVEDAASGAINWRLMTLRKAGKLKIKSTKRAKRNSKDVSPLSEIAMRSIQDKSKLSSDRIMADPKWRTQFDAVVRQLNPSADGYAVRKAAFQLRKTRRLQPELISRLADWGREVTTHRLADLRSSVDVVDPKPGVYIFRDKSGYLYIGQTENLRKRMAEHLKDSHNPSLAKYLKAESEATVEIHSFDPKSRARQVRVRRAYESELIRSRKPKFNILP